MEKLMLFDELFALCKSDKEEKEKLGEELFTYLNNGYCDIDNSIVERFICLLAGKSKNLFKFIYN